MTCSNSVGSRESIGDNSTPNEGGARAWIAAYWPIPAASEGSRRTATRVTLGAISLSNSSHFPLRLYSNALKPVVLPPGRAKLATKPAPTGSITFANTIGTVRVTRCSAATFTLAEAKMTSGASATNSTAYLFEFSGITGGPADVDAYVAAIGPAQFLQPLEECPDASLPFRIVLDRRHKQADAPCGLLRAHSERPSGCRAPEKRDELAPPQGFSLIENHTLSHR